MQPETPRGRRRLVKPGVLSGRGSIPLLHLYFVWALTVLDLQYFLGNLVAPPLLMLVNLGYPPLLLMMALRGPVLVFTNKPWVVYAPVLILVLVAGLTFPFAANKEYARLSLTYLVIYYTVAVATAIYVKTVRQAVPILLIMVGQFAWYNIFAGTRALVPWHPTLANNDAFGALMVAGAGLCYWFGAAAGSRKFRIALYGLALWCIFGVVASYARAAFLSLVVVGGWIWIRSPRKLATAVAGLLAMGVVVAAASLVFDAGFFWNEIMSSFEEGTTEGTGAQRWQLWGAAIEVFKNRPVFGVGGGNFGAFAAEYFRPGELENFPNPSVLYGFNLHNSYMQILSEFGITGIAAFAWALWDFQKRNAVLRNPAAQQRWAAETGGRWNLGHMARGLEAANIANLCGGMFYASLFMPWFFVVWITNRMLWSVTQPDSG